MPMPHTNPMYLFAYRPVNGLDSRVNGTKITSWGSGNDFEVLYKLDETIRDNRDFRDWLQTKIYETDMIVRECRLGETEEWFLTDKDLTDRISIHDICSDDIICDIVESETPGGDIRKYTNTITGGCMFNLKFSLYYTANISITGLEPFSMESINKLIDYGILTDEYSSDPTADIYPSGGRILEWNQQITDEFDVTCGASGSLSFRWRWEKGTFQCGTDGFIVYGVDEDVKQWCDEHWINNPSTPFMNPDEYHLYDPSDDDWVSTPTLRMWWD